MAKKAPAKYPDNFAMAAAAIRAENEARAKKAPAKRKPRPKKPVVPAIDIAVDTFDSQVGWNILASLKHLIPCVLSLVIGAAAGVYAAGGIAIGPDDGGKQDVLSDAYKADRATQIKVLRELAEQPFDGATDDGRSKAGEWFNAQRFRNRSADFGGYTDRVAEAIAANKEAKLADELEEK